jgi:hypothetical protein
MPGKSNVYRRPPIAARQSKKEPAFPPLSQRGAERASLSPAEEAATAAAGKLRIEFGFSAGFFFRARGIARPGRESYFQPTTW